MVSKFGKNYPILAAKSEKDRALFLFAIVLATSLVIVFFMVVNVRANQKNEPIDPNTQILPTPAVVGTVTLYSPERPVKSNTKLAGVVFKEMFWPRNQVPEGAIRDLSELSNLYSKVDLQPGTPVVRSQLSAEPAIISLPLTPGHRAVTIEVDEVSGIEGWASPGSRVDVVLTSMTEGNASSSIIVQNARIISKGGETAAANRNTRMVPTKTTLTLDVPTEDALKIRTAQRMGSLSLLMRERDDNVTSAVTEVDSLEVINRKPGSRVEVCTKGKMRMAGREYLIGCDGKLNLLESNDEP